MKSKKNNIKLKKNFAVLQIGARMNYAVPYILFRNNNLRVFYTDVHSNHLFFQFLKLVIPKRFLPSKFKNLLARKLPSKLIKKFIKDFPFLSIIFHSNQEKITKLILNRALKENFSGANAIYTNFINDDIEYVKKAKDKGIYIVHEIFISPDSGLIMYEENKKFPELGLNLEKLEDVNKGILLDKKKWELSDKILVPSKYCKETAIRMGADSKKISLVPYGIKKSPCNLKPKICKGRILFVGEIGLRKGIHYFAEAARILKDRGRNYNFIAAGNPTVNTNHSLFEGITILGHVPRNEIIYQYLKADIFVLPTLVEGMAIVHLEAMSYGLPIITTPNCGSVVSNSKEGFIIPIRDSQKLASKIEEIIEDRNLRNAMSKRCKKKALQYSWKNYSKNLLGELNLIK